METNETRKGKYNKKKFKEKNLQKWRKNLLEKEWGVSSFFKFQTCIQINKNTKVKKKHFIFIIKKKEEKTHKNKK